MGEYAFPPAVAGSPVAMAMWARALHSKNHYDEAMAAGLAAVEAAPHDPHVRWLVMTGLGGAVQRYHVPMLNDARRNRVYKEALQRAVRPGMTVLEIGTGGGFLSLAAAEAGAEVYTCERDPTVAAAARLIAERNGFADRIRVIVKESTELQLGTDLPQPADLLMSEIFDNRLFGESVVSALADAKPRLLKPDAAIVPPRAAIRCALVNAQQRPERQPLAQVEGYDMSPFNLLAPTSDWWLIHRPRHDRILSNPETALRKDFTLDAPFGPDEDRIRLRSLGGEVNGILQWIRFEFDGGGGYENDPFGEEESCWGRPIFTLPEPLMTAEGDEVEVTVKRLQDSVFMSARIVRD